MKTPNSASHHALRTEPETPPAPGAGHPAPSTSHPPHPGRHAALIALALSDPALSARITHILAATAHLAPRNPDPTRLSLRHLSAAAAIPYRILRDATRRLRLPLRSHRSTTGDPQPHITLTIADAQAALAFALGRRHKSDLPHPAVTCEPVPAPQATPAVAPACSSPGVEAALPATTDSLLPQRVTAGVPPQTSWCGKAAGGAEPNVATPTLTPPPKTQNPPQPLSRKGPRGPRAKQTPIPRPAPRRPSSAPSDLPLPPSGFPPLAPWLLGGSNPPPPAPRTTAILRAAAADPHLTAKIEAILAHAITLGVHTKSAAQRPDNPHPSAERIEPGRGRRTGPINTQNPQSSPPPGRLTLNALGDAAGMQRSSLHHAVKQLRITTQLERRATGRGRRYATISTYEARTVLAFVFGPRPSTRSARQPDGPAPYARQGLGRLYICLLEPDSDSGRFKIGWTGSLGNRLSKFLTSTPFGEYLHHWPCLRTWELTARAYITQGCEHIREEVYRTRDLPALLARAAHFFTEMPDPTKSPS